MSSSIVVFGRGGFKRCLYKFLLEKANIIGNENLFSPMEPPTLTQPDVIFVLFG